MNCQSRFATLGRHGFVGFGTGFFARGEFGLIGAVPGTLQTDRVLTEGDGNTDRRAHPAEVMAAIQIMKYPNCCTGDLRVRTTVKNV